MNNQGLITQECECCHGWFPVGNVFDNERKWETIEHLELHDVYKEGIENLLERMREWIEEASR